MNIRDPRHDVPIWNCGCAALMCILFSALLLEVCNVQLKGAPRLHAICTLACLVPAATLLRSIRAYRPGALQMSGTGRGGKRIKGTDIASAALLAASGFAGAARLRAGWAAPMLLLMPSCVLWAAAGSAWMRLILLKRRKSRAMAGYPASG